MYTIPLMFSSFSFNCILRDDIVSSISRLVSTDVHSVFEYKYVLLSLLLIAVQYYTAVLHVL